MEIISFAEILTAVVMVVGGQQSLEYYRRKKLRNGNSSSDRRRDSLSSADREFVSNCFTTLGMQLTNERLKQTRDIEAFVRTENEATREVIRSRD